MLAIAVAAAGCGAGEARPGSPAPEVCFERAVDMVPCSGAVWSEAEAEARRRRVVVCDLCTSDAHCTERAGGRCELLPGNTCELPRRVCLYPGDACHDPAGCAGGMLRCMHAEGRPICAEPDDPPP